MTLASDLERNCHILSPIPDLVGIHVEINCLGQQFARYADLSAFLI